MSDLTPETFRNSLWRLDNGNCRWCSGHVSSIGHGEFCPGVEYADAWETDRKRLEAMKVLTADDAMALFNVCMSFQAEQVHKQNEVGARFWRDLAGRLSKFGAAQEDQP